MKESMAAPIGVAKNKSEYQRQVYLQGGTHFYFGSAIKAHSISASRLRQGYTKSFCGAFYKKRQKNPLAEGLLGGGKNEFEFAVGEEEEFIFLDGERVDFVEQCEVAHFDFVVGAEAFSREHRAEREFAHDIFLVFHFAGNNLILSAEAIAACVAAHAAFCVEDDGGSFVLYEQFGHVLSFDLAQGPLCGIEGFVVTFYGFAAGAARLTECYDGHKCGDNCKNSFHNSPNKCKKVCFLATKI